MTWGPLFMYYHCPKCGEKYKYELDLIGVYGENFGCCPRCGARGVYDKEGPRQMDDVEYQEVQ